MKIFEDIDRQTPECCYGNVFCVGIVTDRSVHTFMNTNDIWSILDLVQFRIIKFYWFFFCLVIYCNIFEMFMYM